MLRLDTAEPSSAPSDNERIGALEERVSALEDAIASLRSADTRGQAEA